MTRDRVNPPPRRRIRPATGTPADPPEQEAPSEQDASPEVDEKKGYGNPPKQHRWQKGTSGNPKGKAPGTKSLHTLIEMELDEKIEVTERGRKRSYTKRRLAAKQIVNNAVGGNEKALTVLLRREGNMTIVAPGGADDLAAPLSTHEQSILDHFMEAARIAAEREIRDREA